jgi:DNA-binding response OmpR family regulator
MSRILVIEDEEQIRQNFLEVLELEGFEAFGAENGEVGLDVIDQYELDLVICDLLMPGIGGGEVLSEVRASPRTEFLPFIVVTAHTDQATHDNIMELGASATLTKPVDLDELLGAIRSCLINS